MVKTPIEGVGFGLQATVWKCTEREWKAWLCEEKTGCGRGGGRRRLVPMISVILSEWLVIRNGGLATRG